MTIPEYHISPALRKTLEEAFEPLLGHNYGGQPISKHLESMVSDSPLPAEWTQAIATTLVTTLQREGGEQGQALLDAMDGIVQGNGRPAIVIRGLPNGPSQVVTFEAFRYALGHNQNTPYMKADELSDELDAANPKGFERKGGNILHQDRSDCVVLGAVDGGDNPRHTITLDAMEMVDYLAFKIRFKKPGPSDNEQLKQQLLELLQLPVWPLAKAYDTEAIEERNKPYRDQAEAAGLITHQPHGNFTPILYPNPHYDPAIPGSVTHCFVRAPFEDWYKRLQYGNMRAIPEHLKPLAAQFKSVAMDMWFDMIALKQGPVLKSDENGCDLLLFNNDRIMHAGGPHIHATLTPEQHRGHARTVTALDVYLPTTRVHGSKIRDIWGTAPATATEFPRRP